MLIYANIIYKELLSITKILFFKLYIHIIFFLIFMKVVYVIYIKKIHNVFLITLLSLAIFKNI